MPAARNSSPVRYGLCNQTVAVYRREGDAVTRTVYKNAFFDPQKTRNTGKTGSTETTSFLLVIPASEIILKPGDKVFPGEGPQIATREEWATLIPAATPGLAVVRYVDGKYWRGRLVHVEAGG